jgi:hypothetical protein
LTLLAFGRTLASTMSSGFATGKALLRRLPRGKILRGQIDALVYDLYALTPAEIQIVEGVAK